MNDITFKWFACGDGDMTTAEKEMPPVFTVPERLNGELESWAGFPLEIYRDSGGLPGPRNNNYGCRGTLAKRNDSYAFVISGPGTPEILLQPGDRIWRAD